MNLAAAAQQQTESTVSQTVPVVVLGTDALLAAAPYTAVQLAHACLHAGYASVVPASWGDELIAAAVLRRLPRFGGGPAIQCSCPIVAHRLLTTGGDLRPVMLPLVSPPVALARYLRAISHPTRIRITYVGACPGAVDEAIDIRMSPETLIGMLAERQIVLDEQPRVFESIIPPDRRRYFSQPGGVPSADRLWSDLGSRALVEVDSDDFVSEIAERLLAGDHVLMDVAPRLGCVCSGAIPGTPPREARAAVVALEPPRSTAAVVEEQAPLDLDLPIPAVPRTPVDVALATRTATSSLALPTPQSAAGGHRATPTITEARPPRAPSPPTARPIASPVPPARHVEGKPLPRTYVARRRHSTPKGHAPVPPNASEPAPPSNDSASTAGIAPVEASTGSDDAERALSAAPVPATQPSVPGMSIEDRPTEPSSAIAAEPPPDGAASGASSGSSSSDATPATELVVDRSQLHLEGLAPPNADRLPIFTPEPRSALRVESVTPPNEVKPAKARSRIAIYALVIALALFAVAGIAYFAGRSSQSPPETQQIP